MKHPPPPPSLDCISMTSEDTMDGESSETDDEPEEVGNSKMIRSLYSKRNWAKPGAIQLPFYPTEGHIFKLIITYSQAVKRRNYHKPKEKIYMAILDRQPLYVDMELIIDQLVDQFKIDGFRIGRHQLRTNTPVLAPYKDEYYRARVMNATYQQCSVYFLDYGNEEHNILNSRVYPLPEELAKLPAMAFPARLINPNARVRLEENCILMGILRRTDQNGRKVIHLCHNGGLESIEEHDSENDIHIMGQYQFDINAK